MALLKAKDSCFASQSAIIHRKVIMLLKLLICCIFVNLVLTAPAKNRVFYDQRQEGEWNLHASLKNFVLLVIPSKSSTPQTPDIISLLSKTIPNAILSRNNQLNLFKKPEKAQEEENVNFMESKTAPYHVDISSSKKALTKLHPEVISAEEIVIAQSPSVALSKEEVHPRIARAFVLSVPPEENYSKKSTGKGKKDFPKTKSALKLLGAEYEQCGPGLARDAEGVCRTIKQ